MILLLFFFFFDILETFYYLPEQFKKPQRKQHIYAPLGILCGESFLQLSIYPE